MESIWETMELIFIFLIFRYIEINVKTQGRSQREHEYTEKERGALRGYLHFLFPAFQAGREQQRKGL